jgi:hypothetical protein
VKLDTKQKAFKTEEITYLDRKSIQLDRMMLRLFRLLRFDGRADVSLKKVNVTIESLVALLVGAEDRFPGFASRPDIARAWLRSDLLEIMNRGKGDREAVVGPRPLHLNAYKLTLASAVQDYGASDQVWAMLYHTDPQVLNRLKAFFGRGLDSALDRYDKSTPLDLQTLAVLGLVDQVDVKGASSQPPPPMRPVCLGQGRLLAEDLRHLLAYEASLPRLVLAGYIRTIIGLHLSLYLLRLLRLLPSQIEAASAQGRQHVCPLEAEDSASASCPFGDEIVVDLTDDLRSGPGVLARLSADAHLGRLASYVRAVFVVNRLKDYASVLPKPPTPRTLSNLLDILADPPEGFEGFFQARVADLAAPIAGDEEEDPVVTAMLAQPFPAMEKLVELICKERLPNERKRMTDLLDSLAQKNKPGGFLRQTAGARAPRWFVLGSQLLETLVQIAVIERSAGHLRSRAVLIDDFVRWLHQRYGFVIYAPALREVPPEEYDAWRENERAFRERLHQIGFFIDLSDAYNSQTLRPRYEVENA